MGIHKLLLFPKMATDFTQKRLGVFGREITDGKCQYNPRATGDVQESSGKRFSYSITTGAKVTFNALLC